MNNMRFKNFLKERSDFSLSGEETLLSVSEHFGIRPRSDIFDEERQESRAESLVGYRLVHAGDFVMNYMLAWRGAYGVSEYDGIVSPAYSVFKVDRNVVDLDYLHFRTRARDMQVTFRRYSKGIMDSRLRLYPEAFLAIHIALPDKDVQAELAREIAAESRKIDELIGKNLEFIATLKEKKTALISGKLERLERDAA